MTRWIFLLPAFLLSALLLALGERSWAQQAHEPRFLNLAVYGDPLGQPLSSYQILARIESEQTQIVGISNGEHPAYQQRAPYYDASALFHSQQLIVAQYSVAEQLPTTKTRLFSIHIMTSEITNPEVKLKLMAATQQQGDDTPLNLTFSYTGDQK